MQLQSNIIKTSKGETLLIFPDFYSAMLAYNTMQLNKRKARDFFGAMQQVKPQRKAITIDKRSASDKFFGTREELNHIERRIRK